MRILTDNTGQGQLEVLSVLAENPEIAQKQIVDLSSLSKGSVSSNVRKLKDKKLVTEKSSILRINDNRVLSLYREHLEEFLIRDSGDPEEINEIRTLTKERIDDIFEEKEEFLNKTIGRILVQAQERSDIESLNSVFKETDRILREYSTSKDDTDLELIGIVADKSFSITDTTRENYTLKQAKNILKEAN